MPCTADLERRDYLDFLPKRPQGTTKILGTPALAGTKTPAVLKFPSKGATTACVETPVNCPHCGQKWRLRRRLRRQPFILLSFSSSKKARKAQETQSYQRFQCIGHTNFKGLSSVAANTPTLLSSMGIIRQKMILAQSSTKRPTFVFAGESEYTHGSQRKIAHSGLHAETGAFRTGPLSLPSAHSARSRTSPGRVSERQTLPLLGLGRVYSRRTQRAFGTAMRLCASLSRRRRGPAGLRDPASALLIMW